ncbi:MAG TPA: sulfur carrier protein ThiS [Chthoniobacteraceae bacterium]|jgi:thiamine biosynthesis protein ThiS
MTLLINGEPRETPDAVTLPELIEALGLPGPALLIEHNGLALRREEWPLRIVADGDRLEIIQIVAGG